MATGLTRFAPDRGYGPRGAGSDPVANPNGPLDLFQRLLRRSSGEPGLGLGLKPGAAHYRAYVGPPRDYDLIAAMVFNLLTSLGLRQHHRVVDIGCGSLRIGRLLIPYLNRGHYVGVEPNRWLVREGIRNEVGRDQVKIKQPTFSFASDLAHFEAPLHLDFAVAQSILSHTGPDLTRHWMSGDGIQNCLCEISMPSPG